MLQIVEEKVLHYLWEKLIVKWGNTSLFSGNLHALTIVRIWTGN